MEISEKISCSTLTQFYLITNVFLLSLFLFCCLALDFSTIFSRAALPPVLVEAAAAVVLARAHPPLVGQKKEEEKGEKELGNRGRDRPGRRKEGWWSTQLCSDWLEGGGGGQRALLNTFSHT